MLYLGVSDTHESQRKILEALTRKFKLDPALDLAVVASKCPFNYTGADFYALCSDAMLKAMSRKAEEIDTKLGQSFVITFLPLCLFSCFRSKLTRRLLSLHVVSQSNSTPNLPIPTPPILTLSRPSTTSRRSLHRRRSPFSWESPISRTR